MNVYQWLCVLGIPGLFLTTVTGLAGIIRQIRVMKAAMNASLRDRLVQGYRRGIRQGWADMEDRKNMENIYRQYHILGGNGDMRDLRKTFRHLPMERGGPPTEVSDSE